MISCVLANILSIVVEDGFSDITVVGFTKNSPLVMKAHICDELHSDFQKLEIRIKERSSKQR